MCILITTMEIRTERYDGGAQQRALANGEGLRPVPGVCCFSGRSSGARSDRTCTFVSAWPFSCLHGQTQSQHGIIQEFDPGS